MNDTAGQSPAGQRRTRNRRGEGGKLRDELVAAARALLKDAKAESDLTIRGVTRAVGVHPQAFYLHFESLDQLLYAVFAAQFAEFIQALETAAAGVAAGEPALRAMCHEYARFALAEPGRYHLLMSLQGQPHPDWDPQALPGAPALRLLVGALTTVAADRAVSTQRAPGAPPAGRSPGECAVLLWASLHGLVTLRASRPAFPWPPIGQLVNESIDAILSILS